MKRIILTIVTALVCVSMFAQTPIQRSFFGFNLMDSATQVRAALKARNITILYDGSEGIYVEHVRFAGVDWDSVLFNIYKNRIIGVTFSSNQVDPYFDLSKRLIDKYPEHFVNFDEESYRVIYNDGKTDLSIRSDLKTQTILLYVDSAARMQKVEDEQNEL